MEEAISEGITQGILEFADSSFKYILILFNFMMIIVVYIHKNRQKQKKEHHVLFVTAHPDDQVMYFRPSLSSIPKDYYVHLLCLSCGQTPRQQQLKRSAQSLALHKVTCLKNDKLVDSLTSQWPKQQVQSIILRYVQQNNIKAIFTFDQYGISNHPNHKAIYTSLKDLHYKVPRQIQKLLNKKTLTQEQKNKIQDIKKQTIKIYHLRSVNILRKYTGILQVLIALIRDYSWINLNVIHAYKSMAIHQSQFVWYRKLWVFFSQYSYINVFYMTRLKVKGIKQNATGQKDSKMDQSNAKKDQQQVLPQENKKQN